MPQDIDRVQVQRLAAEGAQLLDVLPAREYDDFHLPGAINLPLKALDRAAAAKLDRTKAVITYCYDYQ